MYKKNKSKRVKNQKYRQIQKRKYSKKQYLGGSMSLPVSYPIVFNKLEKNSMMKTLVWTTFENLIHLIQSNSAVLTCSPLCSSITSDDLSYNMTDYKLQPDIEFTDNDKNDYRKYIHELFYRNIYPLLNSSNYIKINNTPLHIQSLNIVNSIIQQNNEFAKGNMHRYKDNDTVDSTIKLVNLFEITFTPTKSINTPIKSIHL